jgi:tetratricopeptide (TPR) repeat protein
MLKRLAGILFGCVALALSGCPNITSEKSAAEWMADGRTHSDQLRWDDAIADFTEALRLEPGSREALVRRAHARDSNGDADQALEDCEAALRLQPQDVELRHFRASIYRKQGQLAKADQDDAQANRPNKSDQRANQEYRLGHYRAAAANYEDAVRLDPQNQIYLCQLAWLQATCPDDALRNGRHAVGLALKACELTGWRDAGAIATLAAAYAETGRFDEAVEMQKKATELGPPRWRETFGRLLKAYQERKPYRFPAESSK